MALAGDPLEEAIIEDNTFSDSNVRFLKIHGIAPSEGEKSVMIRRNQLFNLNFPDRYGSLIETGGFFSTNELISFEFSDLTFRDVSFSRTGEIIKLRHQTVKPITLSSITVENVNGGKIRLEAATSNHNGVPLEVVVEESTFRQLKGGPTHLFEVFADSELLLKNCTFT